MSLVELDRFYSQVEADLARLRLEAAGIPAIVFDEMTLYATVASGVRLMVEEDVKAEALRILSDRP